MFGVSDRIQDITRSSGMVRRIRFIYRKSLSKFGNDPVHLWKVLEKSGRNHHGKWSPGGTPPSMASQPKRGGVPGGLHLGWPATPPKERGESHFP